MLSQSSCQMNCTVAQMIQMISHDLRAPLGTIESLLHLPEDALIAPHKRAIGESLRRLTSMIESLRHQDLDALIIQKNCFIDFRDGLVGLESKLSYRGLTVMFPENPCGDFLVDRAKLMRAFVNLLSNALDAAKNKVSVELEIQGLDLHIRVIDDGQGVPSEFLQHLFQRGMTFGKPDGTGLGLAYAKQIIQGHGGDIMYRRENGLTVFHCFLPGALGHQSIQYKEQPASASTPNIPKKIVSVALVPKGLNIRILNALALMKTDGYEFHSEYLPSCDHVITNSEDIIFKALESGRPEIIHINSLLSGSADQILDRLKSIFRLA